MLQHIVLNLGVGCPILKFGHIHIFQRELNPNLFRVDLALGKQDYRLHMKRSREEVIGLRLFEGIACAAQLGDIARERCRVAGNIDHARRLHLQDRVAGGLVQTLARRVHHEHINAAEPSGRLSGIRAVKLHVLRPVASGIVLRVLDGLGHDLYADRMLCVRRKRERDGACAAVQVEHGLLAGQSGIVHRTRIQALSLRVIDLIERMRREQERVAALTPAICEEALHRGLLQYSLRGIKKKWVMLLLMGVYFGAFHMSIVRFLPMMMMGIVLSYVRMKTDNMFYSSLFHFVHNASTIVASIAASFLYMFSQGNAAAGSGYATETYIGMYLIEAALMPIGLYMGSRLLMYQQTKSEGFFPKERRKKTIAKIVIPTILLILGGLFFLGIGMM